jgi:hypothetical protein
MLLPLDRRFVEKECRSVRQLAVFEILARVAVLAPAEETSEDENCAF